MVPTRDRPTLAVQNSRPTARQGHNSDLFMLTVQARFFNSLAHYGGQENAPQQLSVAAGTTVGDLIQYFRIPQHEIFLVLRNGRDITPGLYVGGNINTDAVLDDGDIIAFSGPVPYSYGYGAPVV